MGIQNIYYYIIHMNIYDMNLIINLNLDILMIVSHD